MTKTFDPLAAPCPACKAKRGRPCRDADGKAKPAPCFARPWTAGATVPRVELHLRDCIIGMAGLVPAASVHLVVTSPPFEELFHYSGKLEDVGNNGSTVDMRAGRFALKMRFVIEQMFRVLAPGCNACIHIQQLLAHKNQHGFMGKRDFRGAMIDLFTAAGFAWTGEFVIPKNPRTLPRPPREPAALHLPTPNSSPA